jgi:hypothetical protein
VDFSTDINTGRRGTRKFILNRTSRRPRSGVNDLL